MITKENAFENLKDFKLIADAINLTFYLDGGTLLGAYRDHDFCDDDQDDIDLSTTADWAIVDKLSEQLLKIGFKIYHKWDHAYYKKLNKTTASQIAYTRNGGKIDVAFKNKKGDYSWGNVFQGDNVVYLKVLNEYIEPNGEILFYGMKFNIPGKIIEYLTAMYGNFNIKVHRSKYSCYISPKAIIKSYEEI